MKTTLYNLERLYNLEIAKLKKELEEKFSCDVFTVDMPFARSWDIGFVHPIIGLLAVAKMTSLEPELKMTIVYYCKREIKEIVLL